MVPKHIVCATDLLETGRHATDVALSLARAFDARLTLLHAADIEALETYSSSPGFSKIARDTMLAQLRERVATDRAALEAEAARCTEAGVTCDFEMEDGRPWEAIIRASERDSADLVVIGDHPPTGTAARLLGNTADRVVRHSHRPVLITSGGDRATWQGLTILVGVDFSEHAARALALAEAWAGALDGKVVALHAAPHPTPTAIELSAKDEIEAVIRKSIEEHLADWCQDHGSSASVQVGFGHAGNVLTQAAAEGEAGLIVVGTRGHTRIGEIVLGSTTERAMARAPVPLVAVR